MKFTPGKPKSAWSQLNKTRIEKLVKEGLMTSVGLSKIGQAKKDRSWNILTNSDSHIDINYLPNELLKALSKNKKH